MKKWLMAVLFGTTLVLGACGGGGDDSGDSDKSDNGDQAAEQAFKDNCASCHGDDLSGQSGPNLQEVGKKYDKDEIADIIEKGKEGDKGKMPAGQATGDDVDLIAGWLADKK